MLKVRKYLKKLTGIFILSMVINSCENLNRCDIQPKSLDSLSENLDTLSNAPEKLEIDNLLINSTHTISSLSDNRAIHNIPIIGNKGCETTFIVNLLDFKGTIGLFEKYEFEHYWYFSQKNNQLSEGNIIEYSPNKSSLRIINSSFIEDEKPILIIKIKDKNGKSYLLKSINPYRIN